MLTLPIETCSRVREQVNSEGNRLKFPLTWKKSLLSPFPFMGNLSYLKLIPFPEESLSIVNLASFLESSVSHSNPK